MDSVAALPRIPLSDIVAELDAILRLSDFASDFSNNGLQIEGASQGVAKICTGVDASPEFYRAAIARGADFLIVHHGISWGSSLARIAGPNVPLVTPLIRADIALYAAHLPLDAHPTLGNNARLAQALGLTQLTPFGDYHGTTIGQRGSLPEPLPWSEFLTRLRTVCPDGLLQHVDFGADRVQHIGVISGGAGDLFAQAAALGLDAYVTGELRLQDYTALQTTRPLHFAAAGHYATERFGVQALAEHLAARFGIPCEFIDLHLPY